MERKIVKQRRSNVFGKAPQNDDIVYGEIAVNYANGGECLFIKNDKDEIVKFDTVSAISNDEIDEIWESHQ